MPNQVKGVLFADYVRMLRAHRGAPYDEYLEPPDLPFLDAEVDPGAWYPMETFERLGLAIFQTVAEGDLGLVRNWGRVSVTNVVGDNEHMIVPGDPRESLMRFMVLRRSLFDFEALCVLQLCDASASIGVEYGMQPLAEQAASVQTMGFFEGLIELADGQDIHAEFLESSWRGDRQTIIGLTWQPAASVQATPVRRAHTAGNGALHRPPHL
jgi:hypothetical protein